MDLREKPGFLQSIGEALLRFRLIFVFLLALLSGWFFAGWQELLTHILSISEMLGMRFAEKNFLPLWPWLVLFVLLLLPRFLLAGKRSGFSALGIFLLLPLALFGLQSSDSVILPVFISCATLSLIFLVFIKKAWASVLFPMLLTISAIVGTILGFSFVTFNSLEISTFAIVCASELFAISLLAGKELSLGVSKTGALLLAFQKQVKPAFISSVLLCLFFVFISNNYSGMNFLKYGALSLGVFLVTFLLGFPLYSFTPLARLRADKRSIKIPLSSADKAKEKKSK